jgi:hypothetical protein
LLCHILDARAVSVPPNVKLRARPLLDKSNLNQG